MPSNVQPPRGMRDFLPQEKSRRDAVLATIRDAFSSYGYREVETPAAEELDRLESSQGGENEKLIYRIQRRGLDPSVPVLPGDAADLGLRFDLTVPLARFYATHRAELPAVLRAIQIGSVWRAERPQRGRYRQFTQCDIDVVGEPDRLAEVELITATLDALRRLGIDGTDVRLNDRAVLAGMLEDCGVPPEAQPATLVTVDKLDRLGVAGVADELRAGALEPGAATRLVALLEGFGGGGDDTGAAWDRVLAALPAAAEEAAAGLVAVRDAVWTADPTARLVADPTLVRGMGYYTGAIFELRHPSYDGSVGGGGRYDGMIGRFAGVDVPACGFSIGFERIVELVDASRLGRRRRQVALVYSDGAPPGVLVAWQRREIASGSDVRLVRRVRNLGRLLEGLEAEGFEEWVSVEEDTPPPADGATLERRSLRAAARGPAR